MVGSSSQPLLKGSKQGETCRKDTLPPQGSGKRLLTTVIPSSGRLEGVLTTDIPSSGKLAGGISHCYSLFGEARTEV